MLKKVFCLLSIIFCCNYAVQAQEVWQQGRKKWSGAKEKAAKKGHKIKSWKNHISNWGLDSLHLYSLAASGRLHTNGWAAGLVYTRNKAAGKKVLWQWHIAEIKNEKEIKQQNSGAAFAHHGKSRPFIFGKINNAYSLQLAYGREQLLFPALLDGNMSVSVRYSAGPALALLKPYYLKLVYVDYVPEPTERLAVEKYSAANDAQFLKPGSILGAEKWTRGLSEIRYLPGAFAELAFVLEPDRPKSFVKTVILGANAACYTGAIDIMAHTKGKPYQASFFVALTLGKRWK